MVQTGHTARTIAAALVSDPPPRRVFESREEFEAFRNGIWEPATWRFGDWSFNAITRQLGDGTRLPERPAEALQVLLEACPYPVSGQELAQRMGQQHGHPISYDDVKVYVRRLRTAIGEWRVATVRGVGYMFVPFKGEEAG